MELGATYYWYGLSKKGERELGPGQPLSRGTTYVGNLSPQHPIYT